jgi:hypothetical protein
VSVCQYCLDIEPEKFLTQEQHMKILRDNALFSDTSSVKIRAINELARCYQQRAIPLIQEVVNSIFEDNRGFRTFCLNVIERIKEDESHV